MSNRKTQTKPVPATYRQTGDVMFLEAPVGKPKQSQAVDKDKATDSSVTKPACQEIAASPTGETGATVSGSKKSTDCEENSKKKKIASCDEYLESYYAGKVKSLSEDITDSIGMNVSVSPLLRDKLISNALKSDFTLDKTRQLFVLSLNASSYTGLTKSLRNFASEVVFRHPIMASQERDKWFPSSSYNDAFNIKNIWNSFVNSNTKLTHAVSDDENIFDKKTNVSDVPKARRNAFFCANIWRYAEQQTNFNEFFRSLRATVFESTLETKNLEKDLLAYLVSVQDKDRSSVADFIQWFHDQTIHVEKQSDDYRQRLNSLQNKKSEVDELLAKKEEELANANHELASLRTQIQVIEEEVRILKVHAKDDLERQASRTLRALEDEIPVLADCLTALNRDPPKVEVAKEYLGTALDTLNNELKILREM